MLKSEMMNKSRLLFKPKSNVPAFLVKTFDILENPHYSDIISWNKEGTAFIVKNINEFSEKVLPKYFKHNNFSSFVRQLNMYDFHKSKQDSKENEFKHKLFRRGQKHLLAEIKRKGSDHTQIVEEQMMANGRAVELNKVKKSANYLNEELSSVKNQQGELEKIGKVIYAQNNQLLNENKLLWEELNKNKEKYEKKVEKLMMFVYSVMNNGNDAIGALPDRKMLLASESADPSKPNHTSSESTVHSPESQQRDDLNISPDKKESESSTPKVNSYMQDKKSEGVLMDNMNIKSGSPPFFPTPTNSHISGVSTLPNTPGMMGVSMMPNFVNLNVLPNMQNPMNMSVIPNTYNAQPYFQDNMNSSPNLNHTATTSGNLFRRDNNKLARPVPQMDASESRDFRENPIKVLKKEPDTFNPAQNLLQVNNLPSGSAYEDPLKLEDWPFALNLSRGPSYNANDLNLSRFNSINLQRVPSTLEPNFSQFGPLYIQNLRSNGESMGLNAGKLESEGMGKFDMVNEDGVPYFSPSAFMKNANGLGAFNFTGNNGEDALYTK